jgi:septal ring-binding cell division protein DamX
VSDGSLLVLGGTRDDATLWHLRPPETKVVDSLELGTVSRTAATQTGDRIYLVSSDKSLIGVTVRGLRKGTAIPLDHDLAALVGTPSGDRLYVAADSSREIAVVDRYRDRITARIELPGQPRDLRIDPLGRYLLVRAAKGDSVWVVAVGTDKLIGTVHSAWRSDLPFVAPDGAIALGQGSDVVFVDGDTQRERSRVRGGADDFWFGFQWTGFRARSADLDRPAEFGHRDSTDTAARAQAPRAESAARGAPAIIPIDTAPRGFVVSFAALLSEQRARDLAAQIKVRGQAARVVGTQREGTTIYRVLLGPFPTREEAERVGRESGQTYWVYEGTP